MVKRQEMLQYVRTCPGLRETQGLQVAVFRRIFNDLAKLPQFH